MNWCSYRGRTGLMVAGCLALSAAMAIAPLRAAAQSDAPPTVVNDEGPNAVEAYWTADRMAAAKPMPMPMVSGAPQMLSDNQVEFGPSPDAVSSPGHRPSTAGLPDAGAMLFSPAMLESQSGSGVTPFMYSSTPAFRFTSSRLEPEAAANLGAYKVYPNTLEGKLFFTVPAGTTVSPGEYVCSATVQRKGIITTAGHCVSDGSGHFFKNWRFVPALRNGFGPFGTFTWRRVVTTSTWHTGGGGVPNAQDVAVIVLYGNASGFVVGAYTGWAGFIIPDLYVGQHLTALGYPCNLDSCVKAHREDTQVQEAGGNNTLEIGSDARGGSSGGGWMANWGEYSAGEPPAAGLDKTSKALVAVTSYGPVSTSFLYQGASILDSRYVQCVPLTTCNLAPTAILNFACVKVPSAC